MIQPALISESSRWRTEKAVANGTNRDAAIESVVALVQSVLLLGGGSPRKIRIRRKHQNQFGKTEALTLECCALDLGKPYSRTNAEAQRQIELAKHPEVWQKIVTSRPGFRYVLRTFAESQGTGPETGLRMRMEGMTPHGLDL